MEGLPPLPLASWRPSKDTLHLFAQIVGKIRLALAPPRNHWWHVTLRVSPRGITTGLVPHANGGFEIELDLVEHGVEVRTPRGDRARIGLHDGLSVSAFHRRLFDHLASFGVEPSIRAQPYDVSFAKEPFASDERHASYDASSVARFGAILRWTAGVMEEFAGGYSGKTSPVHLFWHAFDLAVTRFSGRRAAPRPDADPVEQEAYTHEVASFGFWPGDDDVPAPTFYGYAAPVPNGLTESPLEPAQAKWAPEGGMALLPYDVVRTSKDPRRTLTAFMESVYRAAYDRADWAAAEPKAVAGA